ncbi:MAG: helix-turn-helix domain-containing protein [Oscillospiraceae bacterium]|nr:helix-turn-helix domain-containing protein [Oscillospiraceae bacterium]
MRYKNPDLMEKIKKFAEGFFVEEGRSPSTTEIAEAVGSTRGTIYRYLVEMSERGMIRYERGEITTDKMRRVSSTISAAVYEGAIPCGSPDVIESSVEEYVKLPTSIFGSGELYVIRTTGDSMINAGIESGDLVVVRQQGTANIGDIVVALHGNANTLKRLGYDAGNGQYMLIPENDDLEPIPVDELSIQGVAQFIIKAL